jgi:hypothetical protein
VVVARERSDGLQIIRRRLAGSAIGDDVIGDLLTLMKIVEPGPLDGADMDENILASVIRLDEAKALRGVEPLHCSLRQETLLSGQAARSSGQVRSRFWKEGRQSDASRALGQVVRPKLDCVKIVGVDVLHKAQWLTEKGRLEGRPVARLDA